MHMHLRHSTLSPMALHQPTNPSTKALFRAPNLTSKSLNRPPATQKPLSKNTFAMGDSMSSPPPPATSNSRPGIMLVRPSLHSKTVGNAITFRRWTALHFRDLLNCPPSKPGAEGITRALRYTNDSGDLLYTIHADDIGVWNTQPYYEISRRLDLENTRALGPHEVKVLEKGCGFEKEAMVWDIVDARFGIFEEYRGRGVEGNEGRSYQHVSLEALGKGEDERVSGEAGCALITLTYTAAMDGGSEEEELPSQMKALWDVVFEILYDLYGIEGFMCSGFYRERGDGQPDLHPRIGEGEDGSGEWVGCVFVEGCVDQAARERFREGVEGGIERLKEEEGEKGWDVKVGVWRGDLFVV